MQQMHTSLEESKVHVVGGAQHMVSGQTPNGLVFEESKDKDNVTT